MSVALVIQRAKRMRSMSGCTTFSALSHERHDFHFKKKSQNVKCVFWFSVQLLSETFLIPRIIKQDNNVHISLYKVPVIWSVRHMKCASYEVCVIWSARHMKCPLHEVPVIWSVRHMKCASYEVPVIWSARHMKCASYEVRVIWSARHMKCPSYKVPVIIVRF